jgi:hypothetical protein
VLLSVAWPQARIKQLASQDPPVYCLVLPGSPLEYLRDYPQLAARMFDENNLPVANKINMTLYEQVRSRIVKRGYASEAARAPVSGGAHGGALACHTTNFMPLLQGLRMQVHVIARGF